MRDVPRRELLLGLKEHRQRRSSWPVLLALDFSSSLRFLFTFFGWIARPQSFIHLFTGRNLAGDVHRHSPPFPALHQRLLAQMSIDRFFHHLDALEVHELCIGFKTAIERQAD